TVVGSFGCQNVVTSGYIGPSQKKCASARAGAVRERRIEDSAVGCDSKTVGAFEEFHGRDEAIGIAGKGSQADVGGGEENGAISGIEDFHGWRNIRYPWWRNEGSCDRRIADLVVYRWQHWRGGELKNNGFDVGLTVIDWSNCNSISTDPGGDHDPMADRGVVHSVAGGAADQGIDIQRGIGGAISE